MSDASHCIGIISSYCKETSIHGLSYLVNGEGNKVSLALWAAAITFCFAAAITYSNDNMTQWRESPSAVTFAGMLPIEVCTCLAFLMHGVHF